jgi:hypothetical protein
MNGFETILPFLKPIEHLIDDDAISKVIVNGPHRVFVEKAGFVEEVCGLATGEKSLMEAAKNISSLRNDILCFGSFNFLLVRGVSADAATISAV